MVALRTDCRLVTHGILKEPPQLILLRLELRGQPRGQHQHARLRDGALYERIDVLGAEAKLLYPLGLVAEVGEDPCQGLGQDLARALLYVGDVDPKRLGGLEMALRVGRGREAEDGRRGHDHGDAVGDKGRLYLSLRACTPGSGRKWGTTCLQDR